MPFSNAPARPAARDSSSPPERSRKTAISAGAGWSAESSGKKSGWEKKDMTPGGAFICGELEKG